MTFVKPIGWAAAMLIGCGLLAPSAQAGYTVTLTQQGSNVVASGSGTIDLTDLSFFSGDTINSGMVPRDGAITTGPTIGPILGTFVYSGVTGPTSFGSGGL
jgi:hypothetical protein